MKDRNMPYRKIVAITACCFLAALAMNVMQAQAKKISLNRKKAVVKIKETYTLKLKGAKKSKVKWSSSNKKVAIVKNGKITARKIGKCVVTAKYNGKKYKCTIVVKKAADKPVATPSDNPQSTEKPIPTVIPSATPTPLLPGVTPEPKYDSAVKLSAKVSDYNNRIIDITITNNSDNTALTGRPFFLEKCVDGVWYNVSFKPDVAFTCEAICIFSDKEFTESIDLARCFDNLTAGKYRIIKQIYGEGITDNNICADIELTETTQ